MRAIDMHCHPSTKEHHASSGVYLAALEKMLGVKLVAKTVDEMADDFRRDDVLAMMIASDSRSNTGQPTIPNDFIAGLSKMHPDVFLPGWAVVDPWQGKIALAELERSFTTLGLTGAKWMPILQGFYPHDRKLYPIWDLCQSMGAPVLIHSGTTAIGSGMEGGAGLKLDYARPLPAIDTIAADFPRLTIVMAHPAWPWTEEAIAVLLHKSNVFMDVSGWRPRYMPDPLKREMTRRLQDKLLYGSDYPGWSPGQYLDELEMEGLKPGVIEKIFYKNAIRVLRLEDKVARARDAAKTGTARV
jgi:predicted TIM-barrel fold metal-dependent hydrolase